MTFGREFSTTPPTLSKGLGDSVLTPNPMGSVRGCFMFLAIKNIKSIKSFEEKI